MKNRLRSLVVFDDGRTNGLVVFDDRWWSSMIVGGLEVSGVEVEDVSGVTWGFSPGRETGFE
ncbi:unnamed protein product [Prunus armeniaca]